MNNYDSQDNKELLWNLMQENQLFSGLNENQYNKVLNTFENIILKTSRQNQFVSVTEFNKDVITNMITELNKLKSKKLEMIYSSQDRSNERQNQFDNSLKQKESEMNSLLQPKLPENINFQDDNMDKPLGENMDKILADMIASRERTLEILPNNKQEAEAWINRENNENTESTSVKDKKVSFNVNSDGKEKITNNSLNQFIKKLKTNESDDSNSTETTNNHLLDEIEMDLLNLLDKIRNLKN